MIIYTICLDDRWGYFLSSFVADLLIAVFIIPSLLELPKAVLRLKVWLAMEGKTQFGHFRLKNKYRRIIKTATKGGATNRMAANSTTNLQLFQSALNIISHCGYFVRAPFHLFVCPRLWGQKMIRNNNLERFGFLGSLTTLTRRFLLRKNAKEHLLWRRKRIKGRPFYPNFSVSKH